MNHGVLYGAIGSESWCVMLSKWLLIMMCIAEPVAVHHGLFFCASGCESCCAKLSPVVVNRDVLC